MATRRLAILAHYDADRRVRGYILHHLRRLREECDEIHFVSTVALGPAELDKVRPFCARAFLKQNVGYDFHMWKHAIGVVDLGAWDELLLTNSSVLGPLGSLRPVFQRMERSACDFWGMTDNAELARHVQSYFIVFRRAALGSAAFREFFASVLPYRDKGQVIRSYEVGLTRYLEDQGLTSDVVSPQAEVKLPFWMGKKARFGGNPTCNYPVALLKHGMPYVKIEVLRDNPSQVPLGPVLAAMREAGYDMSLVDFDRRG